MNKCIFTGRITKDLEMITTQPGTELLNFDIAVQRPFKNNDGEYESDFIRCIAFKKTAEFINKYAKKGYVIQLEGEMRNNNYEDSNGVKHYGMQLLVSNVDSTVLFLNKKNNQDNDSSGQTTVSNGQNSSYQSQGPDTSPNPFSNTSGAIDIDSNDLPF